MPVRCVLCAWRSRVIAELRDLVGLPELRQPLRWCCAGCGVSFTSLEEEHDYAACAARRSVA